MIKIENCKFQDDDGLKVFFNKSLLDYYKIIIKEGIACNGIEFNNFEYENNPVPKNMLDGHYNIYIEGSKFINSESFEIFYNGTRLEKFKVILIQGIIYPTTAFINLKIEKNMT
jgi:hypothetical protein